ncbi:LysR family transcriptional regulator [Moritella sp. F3]|uniref:LysR family transcriptional regulator n=1 Tax=Moritella sp. F3 TaxID=2718882 RepID=UPI0018E12714|nr:LysR family transcriptional regulator [Moritella sp. F3]GIC75537.1 LysR family transcriptional regulator [Moritella sp. F1]GIC80682.1 LysR family transcriptional regulator [Moritella sp. F3]
MINPVLLRSFCTLVEVGHFTRSAERLNMTQSGISQHIRKLEEQLGQDLLIREGKQFTLTDAGQRLYTEGKQIIYSLSELEQRVTTDPAFEGLVRVMSPGSIGLKLYRSLLTLQAEHPLLVIDYRFAPNATIEKAIAEHAVDIGFMTSSSTLAEVSLKPIAEESLLLITPAHIEEPSWQALMQLGFIDHPDGAFHSSLLLGANYPEFKHYNQFKKTGFSNQISLILEPVSLGLGFTVLPAYAVADFPHPEKVKIHHLKIPVSETLYLGVHLNKFMPSRVNSVMVAAKHCLQ